MGSPEKPTTRRYTRAQKDQAVRLVRQIRRETGQHHGAVQRVAAQLGYGVESVRSWVKQADIDDGEAPGTTSVDAATIKRLEQEVRELRRANEMAGSGVGFLRVCVRLRGPGEVRSFLRCPAAVVALFGDVRPRRARGALSV